jgi:DNA-binding NtrC family response regulator
VLNGTPPQKLESRRETVAPVCKSGQIPIAIAGTVTPPHKGNQTMGISSDIDDALEQIELAVFSDVTVLITGEKGAAKTLAQLIHRRSRRAGAPFAVLNASRTSAVGLAADLQTLAPGGTIVVQSLASLGPRRQNTLLEHFDRRSCGECGIDPLPRAPRLIFTTRHDLHVRMVAGRLREDLFYRINSLHVRLEGLRANAAAIVPLTEHLLSASPENLSPGLGGDAVQPGTDMTDRT